MKTILLLSILAIVNFNLISAELPYPIIFIHGLDSDNDTWKETITKLQEYGLDYKTNNIFWACLNSYQDMSKLVGADGILGTKDDDVIFRITSLTKSDIYVINFDTWWNQVPNNPILYKASLFDNVALGESASNESSIYKQGYALSRLIKEIINQTGAKKVILVGHSMGGLCAREYLQRRENVKPKWWYNPNSEDGHRVARLITIGTPHLGSNSSDEMPLIDLKDNPDKPLIVNSSSEAVRDLRYNYSNGDKDSGKYLFGGTESGLAGDWHNKDVNCNGSENDIILGLHTELDKTMPLPTNISYHWITSDVSLTNGDGIVDIDRQWVYTTSYTPYPSGITDTTVTHKYHWNEAGDYFAIIRALDEPFNANLAYHLDINKTYIGFRNFQMNYNKHDSDIFKIDLSKLNLKNGMLTINYKDLLDQTYSLSPCLFVLFDNNGKYVADTMFSNVNLNNILTLNETILTKFKGLIYLVIISDAFNDTKYVPFNAAYSLMISFKNITEIAENSLSDEVSFDISPNPVSDLVSISFDCKFPISNISIYNSIGIEKRRFAITEISDQCSFSFSTNDFAQGIYYCTINLGRKKITKPFVVIR